MADIKYEIVKKIGVLSKSASGWAKEINLLSSRSFRSLFTGRVRIVNLGLTLVAIVD